MAIKPWQELTKYFVKRLSPKRFSWGMILSVRAKTLLCFFTKRPIVPKHGPKKGSQKRNKIKSGFSFLMKEATFIQLRGLTELMRVWILIPFGALPLCSNWEEPGNRKLFVHHDRPYLIPHINSHWIAQARHVKGRRDQWWIFWEISKAYCKYKKCWGYISHSEGVYQSAVSASKTTSSLPRTQSDPSLANICSPDLLIDLL